MTTLSPNPHFREEWSTSEATPKASKSKRAIFGKPNKTVSLHQNTDGGALGIKIFCRGVPKASIESKSKKSKRIDKKVLSVRKPKKGEKKRGRKPKNA